MSVDYMKGVEEGLTQAIVKLKRDAACSYYDRNQALMFAAGELEHDRALVAIEREHAEAIEIDAAREEMTAVEVVAYRPVALRSDAAL